MAVDISPSSLQLYYSGSWVGIKSVVRMLNIGEGKLSKITENLVNFFQEKTDREIDSILDPYYYVPIQPFNQKQANGQTTVIFPGIIKNLALYWAAGALITAEFQQNEPNMSEVGTRYVNESRTRLFEIIKYNERIPSARMKGQFRTLPPSLQPTISRELNIQ